MVIHIKQYQKEKKFLPINTVLNFTISILR